MQWNDLIGLQVGQYKVIEELGRGGAARVFRAYDEAEQRMVAFKVLPIESDDRLSFMRRFSREADAIRSLSHPNIVQVYDVGETEEFVYLVLRLVEGGTLRKRIASQRLSTQEACQYAIQIAHALDHAHRQGIIHRDVKPSNMLLDAERPGMILLTDFGTAKILNMRGLTKTGSTVGTPEYMSPEQAMGHEVDQRSDIYALGCTLYESLAGRPPFIGTAPVSVLYQQVHAQPTYIRSYNAEAPRELWSVLRKCLGKTPQERYGTAELLAEALQPFADGLIQPTPAPWQPPQVTRRLSNDELGFPSRPTHEPAAPKMPPPFTPAPAPVTPGMNGAGTAAPDAGGPIPLVLDTSRAPTSRPEFGPRGPRPSLRLPQGEGGSGLLSASMSSEEREAVAAFEPQIEEDERKARQQRVTERPAAEGAQRTNPFATTPLPAAGQPAPNSAPHRGVTSRPIGSRSATSGPLVPPPYRSATTSGPLGGRGMASGPLGARTGSSQPLGGTPMYLGPTSRPLDEPYRSPNSGSLAGASMYRGSTSGPLAAPRRATPSRPITEAEQRAAASMGRPKSTSKPVNIKSLRQYMDHTSLGRRRQRRPSDGPSSKLMIAAIAAALLIVALGVGGMKLLARPATVATPSPTAHATATRPLPTSTPTIARPTATATQNPLAALDRQAASAFRAVTLSPFADGSCASSTNTTHITGGAPVFVNMCMANTSAAGPVTVVVRQNGAIVRTLIANLSTHAGSSYTYGHTLSPGSYDMLVTMSINGTAATARDIKFTMN